MNMDAFSKVLELVVAPTAIVGAITFLLRRWIDRSFEKQLESFKVDLRQRQFEFETRFSALHQARATAIAELYGLMAEAEILISDLVSIMQFVGGESPKEKMEKAINAFNQLGNYYAKHRIYLPADVCGKIDQALATLKGCLSDFETAHIHGMHGSSEYTSDPTGLWIRAFNTIKESWPPIKHDLETQFRSLLGHDNVGAA